MSELKPCPFCGSTHVRKYWVYKDRNLTVKQLMDGMEPVAAALAGQEKGECSDTA